MYSTIFNIGQINKYSKLAIFISILFLCGCSSQTHSAQKETAIPVTLHVEDAKGLPVEGVQVTIVKAPASDQEPSTEIGEILGKTDKNGDIKWDTGKKGDYSVALTKDEKSVTHHISLTEDKKDKVISLVFKE
ncbi:YbfJ family protein [Bacillus inaquosorum]|uniref:YbfJ family protein n=1 Tax=Bacillus inaquosorum TaxID=483913 RepID=A0A9Q4EQR3_9BACI|nr:YbfJ family protein [Bacillus inaquosorum]MCY7787573.1 YbfJ family protein [Bacillus inaquosorum]MCY7820265.1 YbfJ family protein [Bacillus inaquosorum]MCY7938336.1 YbfJ family protein [Bacillus inaquosorum]MCY8084443.1 YbfJ family protein [Bacillus inaquosorum]MCY8162403.1 YbfJ family protein [Bacillus inaquosorum]